MCKLALCHVAAQLAEKWLLDDRMTKCQFRERCMLGIDVQWYSWLCLSSGAAVPGTQTGAAVQPNQLYKQY